MEEMQIILKNYPPLSVEIFHTGEVFCCQLYGPQAGRQAWAEAKNEDLDKAAAEAADNFARLYPRARALLKGEN